jgi:hypothetical protein
VDNKVAKALPNETRQTVELRSTLKLASNNDTALREGSHAKSPTALLPPSALLGDALTSALRQIIREEIQAALNSHGENNLISAEELASKLGFAKTWPYEQARQRKIPCHRIGRYLRFDINEVISSLKKK